MDKDNFSAKKKEFKDTILVTIGGINLKELIIIILILVLIFTGNAVTEKNTEKSVAETNDSLSELREELVKDYNEINKDFVRQKISDIHNEWDEKYETLAYYIEHDELEKVETEMTALQGCIQKEEYGNTLPELDKTMYILNHIGLERIFNYKDVFLNNTNIALTEIANRNVILNFDQFTDDCKKDIRIMKRFTNIMANGRLPLFFENYDKVPRIVEELGITMFPANSPQAKGRVERLWETLQSRLVTEFRIHNITTIEQANEFLLDYIKIYNSKFAIEPSNKNNMFLKLPKKYNLDELLCVKFERTIDNAGVFSLNNSKFQLLDKRLPPKTKVTIYLSQKIGMVVKINNKQYDVQPLELISKDSIEINSLDYHQWLPNVVIELINEFYLKDAKAS